MKTPDKTSLCPKCYKFVHNNNIGEEQIEPIYLSYSCYNCNAIWVSGDVLLVDKKGNIKIKKSG